MAADQGTGWRLALVVLAAQGELEREQNARQVIQKMQARAMNGYWVFPPPIGYRFETTKEHGKLLVRDEPFASIIQNALEAYASPSLSFQVFALRLREAFGEG